MYRGIIEQRALEILEEYPIYKELPASVSGKYHIGETQREHLEIAANVIRHLCDEFNVKGEDRDMLIAATYLHDIGLYVITMKGDIKISGWTYYEKTGYSRITALMFIHGSIGRAVINKYKINRKEDIMRLVQLHMSHWYSLEPQPKDLWGYMICTADYTASRGVEILNYKER